MPNWVSISHIKPIFAHRFQILLRSLSSTSIQLNHHSILILTNSTHSRVFQNYHFSHSHVAQEDSRRLRSNRQSRRFHHLDHSRGSHTQFPIRDSRYSQGSVKALDSCSCRESSHPRQGNSSPVGVDRQ
jgi:hypothetical protein